MTRKIGMYIHIEGLLPRQEPLQFKNPKHEACQRLSRVSSQRTAASGRWGGAQYLTEIKKHLIWKNEDCVKKLRICNRGKYPQTSKKKQVENLGRHGQKGRELFGRISLSRFFSTPFFRQPIPFKTTFMPWANGRPTHEGGPRVRGKRGRVLMGLAVPRTPRRRRSPSPVAAWRQTAALTFRQKNTRAT